MSYAGYLLKIEGEKLDNRYCCGYKITPNRRTDKNSFVDGNGKLNRTILPHKRTGITFSTGFLTDTDIKALQTLFNNTETAEVTYWNPQRQKYETGSFYMPDIEFEVLYEEDGEVTYRPLTVEMIEY